MARFDAIGQDDLPALERLLWCGEVLSTPVLSYWMKRLPHVRFTNLYGPTEATIASSYYTVPGCPTHDTQAIPIGSPCAGEELLVLDDRLQPVAPGETGELYIAGVGLSPGYWRDDEKTAIAFLPDPRSPGSGRRVYRTGDLARQRDDGLFMFLGRTDTQIKHRGYRVELGEIEVALNSLDGVSECAVVGVATGGFEGTTICCAYATGDGTELRVVDLRRALSQLVPTYMLPGRWLRFAALPKNLSGKIDRAHLRDRFSVELSAHGDERMTKLALT
jgi:acyl-coenzyme A synthetase/AMP-(fatty) acid ligase